MRENPKITPNTQRRLSARTPNICFGVKVNNGPFHRPRPLPGLRYFSCLHVRPCLTNKWRKWREMKRKH